MAYLGVNIHDNIILSSQLTQINDKGSLVVGFATNADTSDMLSAFDEGSNIERAENGIILRAWNLAHKTIATPFRNTN